MTDPRWKHLSEGHAHGKRVGDAWYVHRSALTEEARETADQLAGTLGCHDRYDVLKVTSRRGTVSFLSYPTFFDEAFPLLREAWSLHLETGRTAHRQYAADGNPPLLHRKELLLAPEDPRATVWKALTAEVEAAGLFTDTSIIGHRLQWAEELRAKGYSVVGHRLVAETATESAPSEGLLEVQRHKTALERNRLSTPVQALWRNGLLEGGLTFFDYGCGRGGDMAALVARGLEVGGWDPHFRAEGEKRPADVVNLGFVINVIEDVVERRAALKGAWALTQKILAVAALIGGRTAYEKFRLFRDGVLTSIGTFQKYYTHEELGEYIAGVVGREPVSIEPGCYFVFRTDADEQDFLARRQSVRIRPALPRYGLPRPMTPRTPRAGGKLTQSLTANRWELHATLVELYWQRCLELARLPTDSEFPELARVQARLGNPKRVLEKLLSDRGPEEMRLARESRRDDLLVFLALNLFERRRSFGSLSERLQLDIREHLGSYGTGVELAKRLLFSISSVAGIQAACEEAHAKGYGHLELADALFVEAEYVNHLPALLRVYVGCAGKLYGQATSADVVKIHIQSGKVTFLLHDEYQNLPEPLLIERVKVDLRKQQVRFFQYGSEEFPALPTLGKERFGLRLDDKSETSSSPELQSPANSPSTSAGNPAPASSGRA